MRVGILAQLSLVGELPVWWLASWLFGANISIHGNGQAAELVQRGVHLLELVRRSLARTRAASNGLPCVVQAMLVHVFPK